MHGHLWNKLTCASFTTGRDRMVVRLTTKKSNYLCNQCLSPLMWFRIWIRARCTTLCDKVCQWLTTGQWLFLSGPPVSSTNRIDRHDINEILLKVALNTLTPNRTAPIIPEHFSWWWLLRCSIIYLTSIKLIGIYNIIQICTLD